MNSFGGLFLHGFFGEPRDWSLMIGSELTLHQSFAPALFSKEKALVSPSMGFSECAQVINAWARERIKSPRVLFGYSLGGRMARHVLDNDPSLWSAAIFLSTQIGFTPEELKRRKAWEERWQQIFLNQSWEFIVQEWNGLSIFKNDPMILREEENFLREKLIQALGLWSPRNHKLTREEFMEVPVPCLWLYGERDESCQSAMRDLTARWTGKIDSKGSVGLLKNSGHRLLSDSQGVLRALETSQILNKF